jgi:phage-related minor tail protein
MCLAGPAAGAAPSTTRASVSSAGVEANAASGQGRLAVSADGRHVAFVSDASNLVAGDANAVSDVFVRGPLH